MAHRVGGGGGGGRGHATSSLAPKAFALHVASLPLTTSSSSPAVTAVAVVSTALLSSSHALELMRAYHLYVRMHKGRCRYLLLLLLVLLFYFQCTFCGRYDLLVGVPGEGSYSKLGDGGRGIGGGVRGGGLAGIRAGGPSEGGGRSLGLAASGAEAAGDDRLKVRGSNGRGSRHLRWPLMTRALSGIGVTEGRMDLTEVHWWPPSNRTPDATDARYEQGLNVATPNAASLSPARSEPPWSVSTQRGLIATIARSVARLTALMFDQEPPPYELALSAFFRAREVMPGGSCDHCQVHKVDKNVRNELMSYSIFLRSFELRVPLLLYYNRVPVYAMIQHLRLMRVRSYQLLKYLSRDHASQKWLETVTDDVADNPGLHARQLSFESTRLSLVFYLQRLHLRALRHADAMRLETFHFLRYLSTTIPLLRSVWVGQDHCNWPGVSCVIVRVPLNSLIDDGHPALHAFVEDIYSLCLGPKCRLRRCVAPSCSSYTSHLTRRLFTSAAPAYWLRWDRKDDTAAMAEMMWEKAPTSSRDTTGTSGAAVAATASPGGASTPAAARLSRGTASGSKRSVWAEQKFAYEHPHLVLAEPTLLVDIDVQNIVEEIFGSTMPSAASNSSDAECPSSTSSASAALFGCPSDFVTPMYAEGVERPLTGDLFGMQRRLLRTIAEAAPRGLRYGKQRRDSSAVKIPYTFVTLNLANMGLRGYLPDLYDIASTYYGQQDSAGANGDGASSSESSGGAGDVQSAGDIGALTPRSDVYWGRLSHLRTLEARNFSPISLSRAASRRSLVSVSAIGSELQRVLRRVEKIGQRNHHKDLGAYFSEVASLARFQNERWSPYRWSEAMNSIASEAAHPALRRLHTIMEDSAFSSFVDSVHDIDHSRVGFGELNPRLIGLLSLDVSANPLLAHLFPRTWLSIPYLQTVRTAGTSILTPPLRARARLYNYSDYCPASSTRPDRDMKAHTKEAMRARHRKGAAAAAEASPETESSLHSKRFIGAVLIPPFFKMDAVFSASSPAEPVLQSKDSLTGWRALSYQLHAAFGEGFVRSIQRLLKLL
ncbi:hypothetical protein LSCM4_08096 [Leishmania orientalis]|uniref:Uncharacterized protein n=1 Tax=Leishmania orientalis TaxID=2249476 RepID=A0A836H6D8_9TRYP|nr:hypothetical protein LSCM4_08096 [Leishmania orientalis]